MAKIKYSIFFGFLIISKVLLSQNSSVVELQEIYVLGPGDDVDIWCKKENVFFELDDTTLIKFNESSTFEKRLSLNKPIKLEKNNYRIILKTDSNETLHIQSFLKDSVINGRIVIDLDQVYRRCCRNGFERYVFFEKKSSQIQETFCDDKKAINDLIANPNVTIELIGLINESTNETLAYSRINNVKILLLELGIKKEKIIHSIKSDYLEKNGFNGSERLLVYPDKLQKEELGVLVILKEN